MNKINKKDLVRYIAKTNGCTQAGAQRIIDYFTEAVTTSLSEGKEISLIGFGRFHTQQSLERKGINPKTLEVITIKSKIRPKFAASRLLKRACNGG